MLALGAMIVAGLGASPAWAKGGGGVHLSAQAAGYSDGTSARFVGLGGEFVNYPLPRLRTGAELNGIFGEVGTGISAGMFGDFVFARIANADLFVGAGLGVGTGTAFDGGPALYGRPEIGVQWNLGRMAIAAKAHATFTGALSPDRESIPFAGIDVGLLFGHFPIDRWQRPGPGRHRTPPPPPRSRRGPPPPPPPRGY